MAATQHNVQSLRPEVKCPNCRKTIFDGDVIKSRIVRVLANGTEAKCANCKTWVSLPLIYSAA